MSNTFSFSMTYGNGAWNEQFHQTVLLRPGDTENRVINLFPEITYQTFDGFGFERIVAAEKRLSE